MKKGEGVIAKNVRIGHVTIVDWWHVILYFPLPRESRVSFDIQWFSTIGYAYLSREKLELQFESTDSVEHIHCIPSKERNLQPTTYNLHGTWREPVASSSSLKIFRSVRRRSSKQALGKAPKQLRNHLGAHVLVLMLELVVIVQLRARLTRWTLFQPQVNQRLKIECVEAVEF